MSDRKDPTRFILMLCFIAFCLATGVIGICALDDNMRQRFETCVKQGHQPVQCQESSRW